MNVGLNLGSPVVEDPLQFVGLRKPAERLALVTLAAGLIPTIAELVDVLISEEARRNAA